MPVTIEEEHREILHTEIDCLKDVLRGLALENRRLLEVKAGLSRIIKDWD